MRRFAFVVSFASALVAQSVAPRAHAEEPAPDRAKTPLSTHAYLGANALRRESEVLPTGTIVLGIGGASERVAGFADFTFEVGSRNDRTFIWPRLGPAVEGRLGRFVLGGGVRLGALFGYRPHDFFSAGLSVFTGVDVVRFDGGGALRVLVDLHADTLRETAMIGVFRDAYTMDMTGASLLVGYRMR